MLMNGLIAKMCQYVHDGNMLTILVEFGTHFRLCFSTAKTKL